VIDWHQLLLPPFQALNDIALRQLWQQRAPEEPLNDFARLAFAFGLLAGGEVAEAEALLAGAMGDGTASLADLAYVRAFRRELDRDYRGVVDALLPHLNDARAVHGRRIRLRVADALVKLKHLAKVPEILEPYLKPPGCPETLEAQLIVLEGMIAYGSEKEKLIEQVSLLDLLIERGFRLPEAANVVYYASLADAQRIEPLVPALLKSHELLLDTFTPTSEAETRFLVLAGDKHKVPAAVRAAARGYAAEPFEWAEGDPEHLAYLFASHDEHEAARAVLVRHHSEEEIHADSSKWSSLILFSYLSGRWAETMALIDRHSQELKGTNLAGQTAAMRALCLFHLGRLREAEAAIAAQGDAFLANTRGIEAAAAALLHVALDEEDAFVARATEAMTRRGSDAEFVTEYSQFVLSELCLRGKDAALGAFIGLLAGVGDAAQRANNVYMAGEMAIEWQQMGAARAAAGALAGPLARPALGALLDALRLAYTGDDDGAQSAIDRAQEGTDSEAAALARLLRPRLLRLAGRGEQALACLDTLLKDESLVRRHVALGIKGGLLREAGSDDTLLAAIDREAWEWMSSKARDRGHFSMLVAELRQAFHGDAPAGSMELANFVERNSPGNIEALRLLRKAAAVRPESDPEAAAAGRRGEALWIRNNAPEWLT
jgi:hypothetical protein